MRLVYFPVFVKSIIYTLAVFPEVFSSCAPDPRSSTNCRAVFGAWSEWSVKTVEDVLARRTDAGQRRQNLLGNPYGVLLSGGHRSTPLLYVEVPKAGSSSMKKALSEVAGVAATHGGGRFNKRDIERVRGSANFTAFTIVRDPLARFMSGYDTIRRRAGKRAPFNKDESETARFRRFVDMLTSSGEAILQLKHPVHRTLWYHTFSQMWFLEQYPRQINYIMHLEDIRSDLVELKSSVDVPCCGDGLPKVNVKEGKRFVNLEMLMKEAPDAIQKVLHYLRQDYACLGYEPPEPSSLLASNAINSSTAMIPTPRSMAYSARVTALRPSQRAHYELLNVARQTHVANSSVAVLFTGFLRSESLTRLQQHVFDAQFCDVFAVTYKDTCSSTAKYIAGDRVYLITPSEKHRFETFLTSHAGKVESRRRGTSGLWQWFQIKIAFTAFDFESYETLIKSRTDVVMPSTFSYAALEARPDSVHCFSDKVFYSAPKTMRLLWEDFLDVMMDIYSHNHRSNIKEQLMKDYRQDLIRYVQPPNRDSGLGCKIPLQSASQPWDHESRTSGFFSEWAFAYHIVSHELKCLPLPLPREHFAINDKTKSSEAMKHRHNNATCKLG